jgi:hypothetical protein
MFTWLKRRVAPARPPGRKGASAPARTPTRSAAARVDNSLRHAPRFLDTAPLPEVVAEGNTQADWSAWEDSCMALDSQMQDIVPQNRVFVRDAPASQLSQFDEIDAFAGVRRKRDI